MPRTLSEWLSYQERTHKLDIELGLERIRTVWAAMGQPRPAPIVITVGGTNGKGSTVALLESMLRAAGYRVGCYTSPHLIRYNQRIRLDGVDGSDEMLVASFESIEVARAAIPQTYFEFGTLAAIDLMARAALDVAILEVGIGGRLDAVNIVDADVAVVTTVDLDHQEWLGPDRDAIGREKAGTARASRPAIVGERQPPAGLIDALAEVGANVIRAEVDYRVARNGVDAWTWSHRDGTTHVLPRPALDAVVQIDNAATALAAIHALGERLHVPLEALREAMRTVAVPGRLQRIGEHPRTIVDVGHNPQAARTLAAWLDMDAGGRVLAVYGALADKDVAGVVGALGPRVDRWYLAGLDGVTLRGLAADALAKIVTATLPDARHAVFPNLSSAWASAREEARDADTVLLFGSFFIAGAALGAAG